MDILKVENLKKVYIKDKNEFTAVNNVDLNIKEGEIKSLSSQVYKNLEDQVLSQLIKKSK